MIKKLIGIVFSLATIGVMVFAVLGHGNYRSLVWPDGFGMPHFWQAKPAAEAERTLAPAVEEPVPQAAAPATSVASEPLDSPDEYFEDADDDLPSDLFSEESY